MTIRRKNPRHQGDIGVGAAIAWFFDHGYRVYAPLSESQSSDLVVEDDERLYRVQVKTATMRSRYGVFSIDLRTNGGNRSRYTNKLFDPTECDLLFVLTDAQERYVIPSEAIRSTSGLNLGKKYEQFKM